MRAESYSFIWQPWVSIKSLRGIERHESEKVRDRASDPVDGVRREPSTTPGRRAIGRADRHRPVSAARVSSNRSVRTCTRRRCRSATEECARVDADQLPAKLSNTASSWRYSPAPQDIVATHKRRLHGTPAQQPVDPALADPQARRCRGAFRCLQDRICDSTRRTGERRVRHARGESADRTGGQGAGASLTGPTACPTSKASRMSSSRR